MNAESVKRLQEAQALVRDEHYELAEPILESLLSENDREVSNLLGWLHDMGHAKEPDARRALELYTTASLQGSADAAYRIGLIQSEKMNYASAYQYLKTAAEGDHMPAKYQLSKLLRFGYHENLDGEGMHWLREAASGGHFRARRVLLEKQMNDSSNFVERAVVKFRIFRLSMAMSLLHHRDSLDHRLRD